MKIFGPVKLSLLQKLRHTVSYCAILPSHGNSQNCLVSRCEPISTTDGWPFPPIEMARLLLQLHLSASCPSRLVHAMISLILSQMSPPPVQTHRISSSRPRPALMLQSQPHVIFAQHPSQLCRTAMPGEMARLLLLQTFCPSRLVYAMISLIPFPIFLLPVQTHRISSSRPRPALMLQSQPHVISAVF